VTRLALVGDSIAWGLGAAREEDRLAARLVRGLADHGVAATSRVFAVSGARSAGLGAQVTRAVAWEPDVTVVVIGANDLTHLVPPDQAVADLQDAVRRLRAAGSDVVIAPAPDLSMVPHVPPALRPVVQAASQELRRRQVAVAEALGARVADGDGGTARAFRADPRMFSADRFHPSSAGYAVIAGALLPEVLAAATSTV
jgi:lysophospholipase L1-like esterase